MEPAPVEKTETPEEKGLQKFVQSERVIIEIGAGLIALAEPKKGKGIAERISTLREDVAIEHGFWVPAARIRDNLQIGVNEYRFLICGREIARAVRCSSTISWPSILETLTRNSKVNRFEIRPSTCRQNGSPNHHVDARKF